jgi:hypothetical protein
MRAFVIDPGNTAPAADHPCAACPWRTSNHGRRHPGGWYAKANRARLWKGLHDGEMMSCHPTDPHNPVPEGVAGAKPDSTIRECAGAHVLLQRELAIVQTMSRDDPDCTGLFALYRRLRGRRGLTALGIMRYMVRGTPISEDGPHRPTVQDLDGPVSLGLDDALPWPEPCVPDARLDVVKVKKEAACSTP